MSKPITHEQCYDVHTKLAKIRHCLVEGHKTLLLLRGLPGSGKSHLAKSLRDTYPGARVFSTDDQFIDAHGNYRFNPSKLEEYHKKNQIAVRNAMHGDVPLVIVDNTNIRAEHIKPYISYAVASFYEVYIVEPDTSWRYNAAQCARKNLHGVQKKEIERILNNLEYEGKPKFETLLGKGSRVTLTGRIFIDQPPIADSRRANQLPLIETYNISTPEPELVASPAISPPPGFAPPVASLLFAQSLVNSPITEGSSATSSTSSGFYTVPVTTTDLSSSPSASHSDVFLGGPPRTEKHLPEITENQPAEINPILSVLFPKQQTNVSKQILSLSLNSVLSNNDKMKDFRDMGTQTNEAIILFSTVGLEIPEEELAAVCLTEVNCGELRRLEVAPPPPGLDLPKKAVQTEGSEICISSLLERIFYAECPQTIAHLLATLELNEAVWLLAELNNETINLYPNAEFLNIYDSSNCYDHSDPFSPSSENPTMNELFISARPESEPKANNVPTEENPKIEVELGEALCKTLNALFGDSNLVEKEDEEQRTRAVVPLSMLRELYAHWQNDGFDYEMEFPTLVENDTSKDEELARCMQLEEELHYMKGRLNVADNIKLQRLSKRFEGLDKKFIEEVFRSHMMNETETERLLAMHIGGHRPVTPPQLGSSAKLATPSNASQFKDIANLRTAQAKVTEIMKEFNEVDEKRKAELAKVSKYPTFGPMASARIVYTQNAANFKKRLTELRLEMDTLLLAANRQSEYLDLHYMSQSAAVHAVRERLEWSKNAKGRRQLRIITGHGQNSLNGQPIIRPAVEQFLINNKYTFTRANPGELLVFLQ